MRLRRGAILLSLLLVSVAENAHAQSRSYEVRRYRTEIVVNHGRRLLQGKTDIILAATEDSVKEIVLDAHAMKIVAVRASNGKCKRTVTDDSLTITLEHPLNRNDSIVVNVIHESGPSRGVHWSDSLIYTTFHTSSWLPCSMNPSDRATLELSMSAPSRFELVAPGTLVERSSPYKDPTFWRFNLSVPSPAYTFGFALTSVRGSCTRRIDSTSLVALSSAHDSAALAAITASTLPALRFFTERSGLPFPYTNYTQLFIDADVQQEMAGMALLSNDYGEDVLNDSLEDWLVVHELAHQWWGNRITCLDWSDMWLHEGIVTFMTAAFKENHWSRDEYDREMILARLRYERTRANNTEHALHFTRWKTPEEANDLYTYYKGALVLHYLRFIVGDTAFWKGVRAFSQERVGSTASSLNLERAMEGASGQSLETFFDTWVYSDAPPQLQGSYTIADDHVEVRIEGANPAPPLLVMVRFKDGSAQRQLNSSGVTRIPRTPGEDVVSVRIDAGGNFPYRIPYERPLAMLLYQATSEPDVPGRADALLAIKATLASLSPDERSHLQTALTSLAGSDRSRLIRQLAKRMLEE